MLQRATVTGVRAVVEIMSHFRGKQIVRQSRHLLLQNFPGLSPRLLKNLPEQ